MKTITDVNIREFREYLLSEEKAKISASQCRDSAINKQ